MNSNAHQTNPDKSLYAKTVLYKWQHKMISYEDYKRYMNAMAPYFASYEQDIYFLNRIALRIQHWYFRTLTKKGQPKPQHTDPLKDALSPKKMKASRYQEIIRKNLKGPQSGLIQAVTLYQRTLKEKKQCMQKRVNNRAVNCSHDTPKYASKGGWSRRKSINTSYCSNKKMTVSPIGFPKNFTRPKTSRNSNYYAVGSYKTTYPSTTKSEKKAPKGMVGSASKCLMENIMKSYDEAEKLLMGYNETKTESQRKVGGTDKKRRSRAERKGTKQENKTYTQRVFTMKERGVMQSISMFYAIQKKAATYIQREYRKYISRSKTIEGNSTAN